MKRFCHVPVLLVVLCLPIATFAQEAPEVPPIAKTLEKVFEEKEPKWIIERPYYQMSPPVMHLKSSQGDVLIYFFLMDSEQGAKDVCDGNAIGFGNILGNRKKETKLPNFGDDGRLLSDASGRFASLSFRRGKTCIGVSAPNDVIARKFGQYVLNQVLLEANAEILKK